MNLDLTVTLVVVGAVTAVVLIAYVVLRGRHTERQEAIRRLEAGEPTPRTGAAQASAATVQEGPSRAAVPPVRRTTAPGDPRLFGSRPGQRTTPSSARNPHRPNDEGWPHYSGSIPHPGHWTSGPMADPGSSDSGSSDSGSSD